MVRYRLIQENFCSVGIYEENASAQPCFLISWWNFEHDFSWRAGEKSTYSKVKWRLQGKKTNSVIFVQ